MERGKTMTVDQMETHLQKLRELDDYEAWLELPETQVLLKHLSRGMDGLEWFEARISDSYHEALRKRNSRH